MHVPDQLTWHRLSLFNRHLSAVWACYLGLYLLARPGVQLESLGIKEKERTSRGKEREENKEHIIFTSSNPQCEALFCYSFWRLIWKYLDGISLASYYSGILFGHFFGILSGIFSGILSDILSGIYFDIFCGILSGILLDILSGIYSDILFGFPASILSF